MATTVPSAACAASARAGSIPPAGYKVDIRRGERTGRASSEWLSRPDDERFLSLGALHAAVCARAERATARTAESKALRVEATPRSNLRSTPSGNQHSSQLPATLWNQRYLGHSTFRRSLLADGTAGVVLNQLPFFQT